MIELYIKNVDDIWFGVALMNNKIIATTFSNKQETSLSNLLKVLPFDVDFQVISVESALAKEAIMCMKDAYDGREIKQEVPLAIDCLPDYSRKVLKMVFQIPPGYVSSYGDVARAVGGGARAVGNVMASNPFAPIIPCHRVVGSNSRLGGYSGGAEIKNKLLKKECKGYTEPKIISFERQKLQVYPAESVFSEQKN